MYNNTKWSGLNLPEFIQTSKGAEALENRIIYEDYYSNGNIREVKKEDGTPIVYIWGYNEQYLIAKIENANYSEVSNQIGNLQVLSDLDTDRTEGSAGKSAFLYHCCRSSYAAK